MQNPVVNTIEVEDMSDKNGLLVVAETEEDCVDDETYDFSHPENVLIQVVKSENGFTWKGFKIEHATVMASFEDTVSGIASYEQSYGGFLEDRMEEIIDCPYKEGFYVIVGVTGAYFRGDGWSTDDDMDFYCEDVREATAEEIADWH